jgi:hypothetical protein
VSADAVEQQAAASIPDVQRGAAGAAATSSVRPPCGVWWHRTVPSQSGSEHKETRTGTVSGSPRHACTLCPPPVITMAVTAPECTAMSRSRWLRPPSVPPAEVPPPLQLPPRQSIRSRLCASGLRGSVWGSVSAKRFQAHKRLRASQQAAGGIHSQVVLLLLLLPLTVVGGWWRVSWPTTPATAAAAGAVVPVPVPAADTTVAGCAAAAVGLPLTVVGGWWRVSWPTTPATAAAAGAVVPVPVPAADTTVAGCAAAAVGLLLPPV